MIRTMLVMEVPFYREGLAALLDRGGDVQLVAIARDARSAAEAARETLPEVALLDAGLADGPEAVHLLRAMPTPPKLVLLAVNETPENVLGWVEHGIAAYVARDASIEDLLHVLRGVAEEEVYCSPRMAAHLMRRVAALAAAPRAGPGDALDGLSPREHEVLSLLAQGLPNKTIASALSISNATAKNHVHNILEKLRLHRRSEVVSLVMRASDRHIA